ncbi:hypothetical protein LCGC14_3139330 [marine sediment metagenome]|uniref:Uncharacterized protein n=1 Tax=marine sediment metagenome TaxID=412755 RepID=A0A0F8Y4B6_9ZZZZ
MRLYLLKRKDKNINYDQYIEGVVAAMSSEIAERIMLDLCDDGEEWRCILLAQNAEHIEKEGVILANYNAG